MQNAHLPVTAGRGGSRTPSFAEMLRTLTACAIAPLSACATLPETTNRVERAAKAEPVKFEAARGPVSNSTNAAILKDLKSESGSSDILHKHLALEEAINRDSPLVLGNRLALLQDGPATYKAMFAAIRAAQDHINLETYIFEEGEHYDELLRAGVRLYERHDTVLHSKTASIDGVWSTIGSTNLDWRSFLHNDELNAVILGADFARQMDAMFVKDRAASNRIDPQQWQRRSPLLRVQEWLARRFEYWL